MGRYRPRHTENEQRLAISMSVNALIQFLLDVVFEALHLIPTRVNHLSLTFLNAFISFKTLSAIHKDRFSFLHEDCQILWLMEVCLILGDIYYVIVDEFSYKFIYVRLFFIVCSVYNLIGVSYIIVKYQLWSLTYKGHGKPVTKATRGTETSIVGCVADPDELVRADDYFGDDDAMDRSSTGTEVSNDNSKSPFESDEKVQEEFEVEGEDLSDTIDVYRKGMSQLALI
mmetsp:Transcript_8793/g.13158  ORF Transcript_8793/g.13158 Transcript_8793/m.13158 type:complete len:228 (-) Transcript_8793:231-914(-)